MLERIAEPMLRAREALRAELAVLHRQLLALVRDDATCRLLTTAPGVGAVVAATFASAVDDPGRFAKSRPVGAHFGLTPRRYQPGETDVAGGIGRVGDAMARTALYEAAQSILTRTVRFSALKRWAMEVAERRGMRGAKVAVARKLATILHGMWGAGPASRGGQEPAAAGAQGGEETRPGGGRGRPPLRGPVAGTRERRSLD